MRFFFWLILSLFPLAAYGTPQEKKVPPVAAEGVLDLRQWNFEQDGPVPLNGQWKFHPGKFKDEIKPEDIAGLIEPGPWNHFKVNGSDFGSLGFGTYRLRILLPEKKPGLTLKSGGYDSAARLTLGNAVHAIGKPGRSREETDPIYRYDLIEFTNPSQVLEIQIEVSNFFHKNGGMLVAPVLGESSAMHSTSRREQIWQAMLAATFLIFSIYHLILHGIRRNPVALHFASYCTLFFVRTLLTGEGIIHNWLPNLDFRIDLGMEYLGLFLLAPLFALFLRSLFPEEFPLWFRNIFLVTGAIFLPALLFPPEVYSHFLNGFLIVILLMVSTALITAIRAVRQGRAGAKIFLIGFIILSIGILADISTNFLFGISTPFASVGMIGYILAQAVVIAMRFSAALSESERLSDSLRIAYSEAVELRGKLAQKEKLATIGDMAAGIVHDLKNPVGIIKGSVEMADDDSISRDQRREMLNIINDEADRMLYLAQDILDFSHGMVSVKKQPIDLEAYAERIRTVLLPNFTEKQIKFSLNLNTQGSVQLDPDRFLRVIVNIAGNAAAALPHGGEFKMEVTRLDGRIGLTLRDNGPGIPEEIRSTLFQPFVTHGKAQGTGLGMAIAKSMVEAHGGTITFETETGKGTTFTIEVPA
ncbi:MAG: sensor histidine kinase [Leptospirales bacterium]|nr:sensor histidine kinase [Leptospirales bacterium]